MSTTSAISAERYEAASRTTDGAVFVDHTGVRRRIWSMVGAGVSIVALLYLALLLAAVLTSTGPGTAT